MQIFAWRGLKQETVEVHGPYQRVRYNNMYRIKTMALYLVKAMPIRLQAWVLGLVLRMCQACMMAAPSAISTKTTTIDDMAW